MTHLENPLVLHTAEDSIGKQRGEDKKQSEVQSECSFLFIGEMINWVSFRGLVDNVEVNFDLRHHLIVHVSRLLTVHDHEVVNLRHVAINEDPADVFTPLPLRRYGQTVSLKCKVFPRFA